MTRPFLIVFLFLGGVYLTGCGTEATKPDSDTNQAIAPSAHLQAKPELPSGQGAAAIPSLATMEAFNLDPKTVKKEKLYSVSAINVPVTDLLFNLAVDAGLQLDLSVDVQGYVTVNAINQPLDTILKRISEQVNAIYTVEYGVLRVLPDQPYWHSYEIDYVNVVKRIKDATVMKMSVGNVGDSQNSRGNQASEFNMSSEAEHDFWGSLKENVQRMAMLEVTPSVVKTYPYQNGSAATTTSTGAAETAATELQVSEQEQLNNLVINKEAGILTVYTSAKKHKQIKRYLETTLNRTNKQVLIEATVVEVELNDRYQAGVDWSASTSDSSGSTNLTQGLLSTNLSNDPNFSINLSSLGTWNFNLGIKMLEQFGDAKVLSSPKIMAMNNQAALLKVVDNEVYFTVDVNRESATASSAGVTTFETTVHTVPVGFMMHVTPFISEGNHISLNIRPTLSRIVGYVNDPNPELASENVVSQIPIIQEREMDSVLRLRNRQTAVIGGLIQDVNDNSTSGVPILSSIPWIGNLFSYRDDQVKKSELIIFIRPIIVSNPDVDHGDLVNFKPYLSKQETP